MKSAAAPADGARPPEHALSESVSNGPESSPLRAFYRLKSDSPNPRRRSARLPRKRRVAAGKATVKARDPRPLPVPAAAPAAPRAPYGPARNAPPARRNAVAITRLMPSKMSVAAIGSTFSRSACQPAISASTNTASTKMTATPPKTARRACRAIIARKRNSSASAAIFRRLMLRTVAAHGTKSLCRAAGPPAPASA